MNTHQIHILSFTRSFSSSDTKTSFPYITRPRIRAHYTKRQLFFRSDFRLLFSSMVQHVRRFCHNTPIVSRVAITVVFTSTMMHAVLYVCAFHNTGLLAIAEGPDPLSVSVVRLSRNSLPADLRNLHNTISVQI